MRLLRTFLGLLGALLCLMAPAGAEVAARPGLRRGATHAVLRAAALEPGLAKAGDGAFEWQFHATREDRVPPRVLRAASAITIAVVDTGADLFAPDLAAKAPAAFSVVSGTSDVRDRNGHGTFVASLAAGAVSNGDGIAGFGGDARLLVVQAGRPDGSFTDVDEAAGIVYAVDHRARIVNLSLGGTEPSRVEQNAVQYALDHGVLVVAAAGNDYLAGNPPVYPAALLGQASSTAGGAGLAVGASTIAGRRASFSSTGSFVSVAAPGDGVLGALSSLSSPTLWPRARLPGTRAGVYGFGSGTSFAAPEVAGAAALVWAANPSLQARQVAALLESTASGHGRWTPQLGYGVIDVAAAVAAAERTARPAGALRRALARRLG